ncbi:MAG: histidine--tRNA ligase [Bacteroidota bacterium]|jgi:histidyl-tRNA synthetase
MAKEKPSIPKGTRDFGPEEVAKRKYILNTIEKVFIKYGFMPIETPTMENLSTLTGKYGDEGDKLLFRILDSGETFEKIRNSKFEIRNQNEFNNTITEKGLRYDLTVPFARYVVMNRNEITFPFKRYQMQPVWRADRPQKGRYREFWQCDADVVGSDSLLHELDLLNIYQEVFKCLGVDVEIKINNRKILAGIAEVVKGIEHLNTIAVAIDKLDKIGKEGVSKELTELNFTETEITTLFDIITIKGNETEMLEALKNKLQNSAEGLKGIEELEFIFKTIEQYSNSAILKIDFSLARGLSYYTGCIFEVAASEGSLRSSIGGGGRYDNLTGIFGLEGVSGVGISFGLDRIYDVIEELKLFPETLSQGSSKVLICANDSIENIELAPVLELLSKLRNEGIASEIYTEKINVKKPLEKPIKYASSKAIPYALIYTENEPLKLKNLATGFQEELSIEAIVEKLNS